MSTELNEILKCEVCENEQLIPVLNLGLHPLCDDLIAIGDSRQCDEYPIDIMYCKICLTAHQHYQVPKRTLFPSTYHYRSRFTADVLKGMQNLVASCEYKTSSLNDKKVLDIGCNDGSLLDFFKEKGASTYGVEPTAACIDAAAKNHITYNDFFTESLATEIRAKHGVPDIITFTNVFAHIENLHDLIKALNILCEAHTIIVIENHYLGSILDANQFDTFYHEHPRTYSCTSFSYIAKALNMSLIDVEFPARYGGNIRVFLGSQLLNTSNSDLDLSTLIRKEDGFFSTFKTMHTKLETWKEKKVALINEYVKNYGKLRAKAFPGRAAILIKLLGLSDSMISAVYEKPGSLKIGHYVPGTRIPIISDKELFSQENDLQPILNLAWHIPDEITAYMRANNYNGQIINILSVEDFALEAATAL